MGRKNFSKRFGGILLAVSVLLSTACAGGTNADGSTAESVRPYIQPIEITGLCTVTAWGSKDGKKGTISKTYTKAASALTDLTVMQDGGNICCQIEEGSL